MKRAVPPSTIRKELVSKLSAMYSKEVPVYAKVMHIVEEVNKGQKVEEHHGAIRLVSPEEMTKMARLFRVMNMYGVNYYNLSPVGLPIHSTAFRPVTEEELAVNPFRVFCSLLRADLVPEDLKEEVKKAAAKRDILSSKSMEMIELSEKEGGLTENEASIFVDEALLTFKRREEANVPKSVYQQMLSSSSLLADVAAFQNPHINHLTPETLDIDKLFDRFHEEGYTTTPIIQGPPKRNVPILLRQMSVQAVVEQFKFPDGKGGFEVGEHRARFGEYETKGEAAVTPKGRALYDKLLDSTHKKTNEKSPDYTKIIEEEFKAFPDDMPTLRKEKLIYVEYFATEKGLSATQAGETLPGNLEKLIDGGFVDTKVVPYHDFLPVSATGIFKSNLVEGGMIDTHAIEDRQAEIEALVGYKLYDSMQLAEKVQTDSITAVSKALKVTLE